MKRLLMVWLVVALVFGGVLGIKGSVTSKGYSKQATKVLKLVNKQRAKRGLSKLKLDPKLQKAANKRAKEIAKYFSHTRPNGKDCFTILAKYNITYRTSGENIAAGQPTPKSVMNGWMHSPGHKANILGSGYGKIGIGYYRNPKKPYQYYWVQIFTDDYSAEEDCYDEDEEESEEDEPYLDDSYIQLANPKNL